MARINFDEKSSIVEPIEITLGGKDLDLRKVTCEQFKRVQEILAQGKDSAESDTSAIPRALISELFGIPMDEVKTFDVKSVINAATYLMTEIKLGDDATPKNLEKTGQDASA
jgi:hypothetical protein